MPDVKFTCSSCDQRLVVNTGLGAFEVECPHCGASNQVDSRDAAEHARTRAMLDEAIGELCRTRQELSQTRAQLEESMAAQSALQEDLGKYAANYALAENRRIQVEAEYHARQDLWQQHVELIKTAGEERDQFLRETAAARAELAAAQIDLQALRVDRKEDRARLRQTEQTLAEIRADGAQAHRRNAELAVELQRMEAELVKATSALEAARAQCSRLTKDLNLNPELMRFVELRDAGEKTKADLSLAHRNLSELQLEIAMTRAERDAIQKEKTELGLKLAAAREALESEKLEEENTVLRALVDRLNEELREVGVARRRSHGRQPGPPLTGAVADLKHWLATRAFLPET